jgi:hypothetical protein
MRSYRNVITACVSVTSLDSCDHIYRAGCSSTEPWFSGRPAHRRGLSRGMPLDALAKRVPVRAKRGAATAERSEGTILTRRAETSEAQALFMSSAAVAKTTMPFGFLRARPCARCTMLPAPCSHTYEQRDNPAQEHQGPRTTDHGAMHLSGVTGAYPT